VKKWQEYLSSYKTSTGGIKTIPAIKAHVSLLNADMTSVSKTYLMERCLDFKIR
jgi:hypothetical protein